MDRLKTIPNAYPVEVTPPDIAPWAEGTEGTPFVQTFRATEPGPHVALTALVHGNEPCGAIVLDRLLREGVRPVRGTLSLAFVNVAAYERFDPAEPNATRWVDEDLNRLWSDAILDGDRDSTELRRARELRPFVRSVDLLLDIHSMQHPTRPLMMAGPAAKGLALARRVGVPDTVVVDAGHAAGPRMRDHAPFVDPAGEANALLVECGQHWSASSVDVAMETALRFLHVTGAVPAGSTGPEPEPQQVVEVIERVTVETEDFAFVRPFRGFEVIERAGTVIARDGGRPVETPCDRCVLVMPSQRLWPGQTAVRLARFLQG
jgi:predicted deacylase